jgi:hypothetical protein
MYKCKGCGYISDDTAPDICPKCGANKSMFEELSEDSAILVGKSRCTNYIHMEITGLVNSIISMSRDGIEENLDPNCVKIFNYIEEHGTIIKQMIKAELEAHVGKGKWG